MERKDLLVLDSLRLTERSGRAVYAVERSDGSFKVGRTTTPYSRMCLMFDKLRRNGSGLHMVGAYVALTDSSLAVAEHRLLAMCRAIGLPHLTEGREVFSGLTWPVVRELVDMAATTIEEA